jgi:hypothetical protein
VRTSKKKKEKLKLKARKTMNNINRKPKSTNKKKELRDAMIPARAKRAVAARPSCLSPARGRGRSGTGRC